MTEAEDTRSARLQVSPQGLRRFQDAVVGMTVHWGIYAQLGRGEWVMHNEKIATPEYEKLQGQFNPDQFDAEAWADLMVESGMRFFLITAKHHDGFCMYDTELTDYKVTNTRFGRDPIAELADACRRREIALHFYYSLLDWHHPAYRSDWPAYVDYYQGQVRELCSNYGSLGGVLFDGYWPAVTFGPDNAHFQAGGEWDLAGTYDLIHSLQPDAAVTNNHHVLPLKGEDYQVWELDLPGENTSGFNAGEPGDAPQAAWFNVGKGWAYYSTDQETKSAKQLAEYVTRSAERGAVCFLNVGPTPEGTILAEEAAALRGLGDWLRGHREQLPRSVSPG